MESISIFKIAGVHSSLERSVIEQLFQINTKKVLEKDWNTFQIAIACGSGNFV